MQFVNKVLHVFGLAPREFCRRWTIMILGWWGGYVAPNLPWCSPTMLSWPNYSPCMGGCCPRGSRACWIKYNCPEHNAKNDRQPPPDKSVSVSPERLCEKSHCPLSFGAVEDGQSGRRLRFQHGRQVEGTDTKCLLSRWGEKKWILIMNF